MRLAFRLGSQRTIYSIGDRTVLPCRRPRIVGFVLSAPFPIPCAVADCYFGVRRILCRSSMASTRFVREENIPMDFVRDTGNMVD